MAIDKSLVSGSTTMLLLKLLSEKDMYGYEMIEELKKRSENVFALKAGTLYPLLHGLEDKGLLTCYEQEALGKVRKYYSITKKGQERTGGAEKLLAGILPRCGKRALLRGIKIFYIRDLYLCAPDTNLFTHNFNESTDKMCAEMRIL